MMKRSEIGMQPIETTLLRQVPTRLLAALDLLVRLRCRPTLMVDRNGRGEPYLRLQCAGSHRLRSVYLGRPTADALQLLRRCIQTRWPDDPYLPEIQELTRQHDVLRQQAKECAARCQLKFSGYQLGGIA